MSQVSRFAYADDLSHFAVLSVRKISRMNIYSFHNSSQNKTEYEFLLVYCITIIIMESIFSFATFVVTPSCHVKFSSCANELNQLKILQGDIQHLRVCIPKLIRCLIQIYIDTIFKIKVNVIIAPGSDP